MMRHVQRIRAAAVAAIAALGISCHSAPSAPGTVDVSGDWTGTTCPPSQVLSCAVFVVMAQSGSSVAGTWTFAVEGGDLAGSVRAADLSFLMTPRDVRACTRVVSATVNGDQLTGTWTCGVERGAIALTRVRGAAARGSIP